MPGNVDSPGTLGKSTDANDVAGVLSAQNSRKTGGSGKILPRQLRNVQFYQQLVRYALDERQYWEDRWRESQDEYNIGVSYGTYWRNGSFELDEVRPARANAIVQLTVAQTVASRPKVFLEGYTARQNEGVAQVMAEAANNEWQQDFALVRELELCVQDASRYGLGWMLTSFENSFETVEEDTEEAEDRAIEKLEDPTSAAIIDDAVAQAGSALAEGPEDPHEPTWDPDNRVVKQKLISRRISTWSAFGDPDADSPETSRFFGRRIIADYDEVVADPDLDTQGLQPDSTLDITDHLGRYSRYETKSRRATTSPYRLTLLFEVYERQPDGSWHLIIFARNHNRFLRKVKMPYWIGCPIKVLRWNQDGENFYCQSDIHLALSEIVAERLLYTKTFDGFSREQVDTTFYDDKSGISEKELNAACDPNVGKFVKMTNPDPTRPLSNYIFKLPKDPKSPEALNLLAFLERGIQTSTGFGPNQFGQALKSGTTATEAAEVGQFVRGRASHKVSAVERFIAAVTYDRLGLMAQYYDAEDITRLVGAESAQTWEKARFTLSDVQNGLSVIVEPGSTQPKSDQSIINNLVTVLQISQANPMAQALVNTRRVLVELFEQFGFKEGSEFVNNADSDEDLEQVQGLLAAAQAAGGGGRPGPRGPGVPTQPAQPRRGAI